MTKPIMVILILALALGLFGAGVLGQATGAREIATDGNIQQKKVSMTMKDKSAVYGSTVRQFLDDSTIERDVDFTSSSITDIDLAVKDSASDTVKDRVVADALFKMTKTYAASGRLESVEFTQIDLSMKE